MKRKLTTFAAAGALLATGAGFSAAQAQGYYGGAYGGDYAPTYVAYDYGWGPGPLGALIAAPVVVAAGVVGAAATLAAAPFIAGAALATAPLAAGYYADPYYDVGYYGAGYYGPGYRPVGWGYNYGPTYVAWRNGPLVRRAAIVTRGPYRSVRAVTPVRAIHGRPVHMRQIHNRPIHTRQVQAQPVKVTLARAN